MLPLLLLIHIAVSLAAPKIECDLTKLAIDGGNYTLKNGGNIGSKVHYSCPKGKYPYPTFFQECLPDGQWTHATDRFVCKDVYCPGQVMIEGGEYFPRKAKHSVGDVLHLQCYAGFARTGPETRICQDDGQWSGTTTTCESYFEHCSDPGVPPGARKIGTSYGLNDKVRYRCQAGLHLIGSKERECMKNKRWSGAEPICRDRYMYDTPEMVAESFSYSIAETIARSKPDREERADRKLKILKGDPLNIFIVLDTSKSVGPENFETAKDLSKVFIEMVSTYDIEPRYAVISYASNVIKIVSLHDVSSLDPGKVIEELQDFEYSVHDDKTGTNTRGAVAEVYNMLSLDRARNSDTFLKTRNVILLMTDGKHNMGGDPDVEFKRIRDILEIKQGHNDREQYLDVYMFGLGEDVSEDSLNDAASKKNREQHVFKLESVDSLKKAFDEILDETETFDMCGVSKDYTDDESERFPWITKITVPRPGEVETCKGSIISRNFILTAAHCFHEDDSVYQVNVAAAGRAYKVKNIYRHPKYNQSAKKDKNILQSFDYDVALLELNQRLDFSSTSRPICLPCTSGSTWALKMKGKRVTCTDHENHLLSGELVKALFITETRKNLMQQMDVLIKQGSKRNACLEDAKKMVDTYQKVAGTYDIRDLVTDQFLCTGGIDPVVGPQTCKGDAGSPLIIEYRRRYIQVGVTSWGTVTSCDGYKRKIPPSDSRDFYVNLFSVMPWIQEIVKDDLTYI